MDKQREEFEAWVREYGNYPRRPELKTSDGAYHYLHTESEWRAWQAAQAAQPAHHLPEAGNMVAQPEGWKPSDKPMTNERARYFMERFKNEEKLLGPHEQSAVDYVIAMLQQAQPERAPLSDAEIEQEFCNITGLETGINPAAADTKRALVWFKKGYAHGIKQGGQHD